MRLIELTRGAVAVIDDDDYALVAAYNWHLWLSDIQCYAVTTLTDEEGRFDLRMHNLIMQPPPGLFVDHINRCTLDNRRSNLRIATHAQNMSNRVFNRTGFRGVYETAQGRWRTTIRHNGELLQLGTYDTAEEAARVWDAKAKELRGQFAMLNFPYEE